MIPLAWGRAAVPDTPSIEADSAAPVPSRLTAITTILIFELLVGGTFAGLAWRFSDVRQLTLACLYVALLSQISLIDFHYRLVLNLLSYPSAIIAIIGSFFWSGLGIGSCLLGGLVAIAIFTVIEIVGRGAMGRGDTKLAAVIGLMRGFPAVWTALVSGIVVGGLVALILLLTGGKRKQAFAYGPSLAAGAIISFFVAAH